MTFTNFSLEMTVPSPSWPSLFKPEAHRLPSSLTTKLVCSPTEKALTPLGMTWMKRDEVPCVVPSPNEPLSLEPAAHRLPSFLRTMLCVADRDKVAPGVVVGAVVVGGPVVVAGAGQVTPACLVNSCRGEILPLALFRPSPNVSQWLSPCIQMLSSFFLTKKYPGPAATSFAPLVMTFTNP